MAGIGGATFVQAQANTFVQGMSTGRDSIAIAFVMLGFCCLTRAANARAIVGWTAVLYQLMLAIPYVLTLSVLARGTWAGGGAGGLGTA